MEQIIVQRRYEDFPDDLILCRVNVPDTARVEATRNTVLELWESFKAEYPDADAPEFVDYLERYNVRVDRRPVQFATLE